MSRLPKAACLKACLLRTINCLFRARLPLRKQIQELGFLTSFLILSIYGMDLGGFFFFFEFQLRIVFYCLSFLEFHSAWIRTTTWPTLLDTSSFTLVSLQALFLGQQLY